MAKGGAYEREVCKQLSLWWSYGEREDLLWRTAGSGARATVRARKRQQTANHHGDITATDPDALPLVNTLCFEIKRGYNHLSVSDVLDLGKKKPASRVRGGKNRGAVKKQTSDSFAGWVEKASRTSHDAGIKSYALITKRDSREALIFLNAGVWEALRDGGARQPPRTIHADFRYATDVSTSIVGMRLEDFLSHVRPEHVREVYKRGGGRYAG